jgi:predicted RND superfamily exporter protein
MVENRTAQLAVLGVFGAAFAWSLWIVPHLTFSQDNTYAIHNAVTKSWTGNPIYQMEMSIRRYFGGVYPLVVMVRTKGDVVVSGDLDVLRDIDAFEIDMRRVDGVGGTLGLPDYLKVMNRLFYGDKEEAFTLPPNEQGLAEYVFMYEDGEPGVFDAVVSPGHKAAAIVIMVRDTSLDTVDRVMAAARQAAERHLNNDKLESIIGGGAIAISAAFNDSIGKWLLLGTILSAAGTFLLVAIMLASPTIALFLLAPLLVGIFLTVAILHECGIPMDSNMTTALAIASGVGIDSEVYLLYRFREEYAHIGEFDEALVQAFTKIRRALLTSNLALIIGCWALIPIPLYVGTIGFGMGLILLICFLISYFVTPALWAILRPAYLTANIERREYVPEARRA